MQSLERGALRGGGGRRPLTWDLLKWYRASGGRTECRGNVPLSTNQERLASDCLYFSDKCLCGIPIPNESH